MLQKKSIVNSEQIDSNNEKSVYMPEAKLTQPLVDSVYVDSFKRDGKKLYSEIYQKRGCINNLKNLAELFFPKKYFNFENYIVTDSIVDAILGDFVLTEFKSAGMNVQKIVIPVKNDHIEDEAHKSTQVLMNCCDSILCNGVSKHSYIISLGGGVVNNIAGVIASLLYRGIGLVHIPTTVMAMIDAAIDFKQAVNHKYGKNLIGTYYPATSIIIDPDVLDTLSDRHIFNGIAEGVKHGLTQSKELLDLIIEPLKMNGLFFVRNKNYLDVVCRKVIEIKIPTLNSYHDSDYNEMVPQYGHAVGHAVEHLSQKKSPHLSLFHGEALSIGMCVSVEISKLLKLCTQEVVDEHYRVLMDLGLPIFIPETMEVNEIIKKITYDKHYAKKPFMGLICAIGEMASKNNSYAWEIKNEILAEALRLNIIKRQHHKIRGVV